MNLLDYSDFTALLAKTPNTQDNAGLIATIRQLAQRSMVEQYPWTYNIILGAATQPVTPGPGGTVNGQINIDASAPFVIISTCMKADVAGAAQTVNTEVLPNATILLTDSSTGRQFMDAPVAIPSLFGSARYPYIWPEPRIMPANTALQWQITSFEAANTNNLRLSFNGYKLLNVSPK